MNSKSATENSKLKSSSQLSETEMVVYREQVRLLYKLLPFAILAVVFIAPIFVYIVWDYTRPAMVLSWLALIFIVTIIRYLTARKFNRTTLQESNIRRWETYYLAGVAASALLWGSTSIWFQANSPVSQLIFHIFIVTGLISGSIATLASRPWAFRLFLLLILLP